MKRSYFDPFTYLLLAILSGVIGVLVAPLVPESALNPTVATALLVTALSVGLPLQLRARTLNKLYQEETIRIKRIVFELRRELEDASDRADWLYEDADDEAQKRDG